MTRVVVLTALVSAYCLSASASVVALADWCVNVNGDTTTACNGGGAGGSGIDLSAFDQTLEPSTNNLGTISVTLGAGMNQYALVYMDYDINFSSFGSFDDSGKVNGALPANVSYELDDPNTSNIFSDFASDGLTNNNNVPTPGGPPNQCCDVSWALGIGGIDVAAGDSELLTFAVSSTAPTSGFYLQQTNATTSDSIYLTESASACMGPNCGGSTPPPPIPEPRGEALIVALSSAIFIAMKKMKQRIS